MSIIRASAICPYCSRREDHVIGMSSIVNCSHCDKVYFMKLLDNVYFEVIRLDVDNEILNNLKEKEMKDVKVKAAGLYSKFEGDSFDMKNTGVEHV